MFARLLVRTSGALLRIKKWAKDVFSNGFNVKDELFAHLFGRTCVAVFLGGAGLGSGPYQKPE